MKLLRKLCVVPLAVLAIEAHAQTTLSDIIPDEKANKAFAFDAGLQYVSNTIYAGRGDVSGSPSLLPSLTVVSKWGVFLNITDHIDVRNSAGGSGGISVSPGYLFAFDMKKKFIGIGFIRYYVTNEEKTILSPFNTSINGQFIYNGWLNLCLSEIYNIELKNEQDNINILSAEKRIWVYKTSLTNGFQVIPYAGIDFGTQLFTETYYSDLPSSTVAIALSTQRQARKYQLLAITGSLPISYVLKNFQFIFSPHLMQPFNRISYPGNTAIANSMYLYYSMGLRATF